LQPAAVNDVRILSESISGSISSYKLHLQLGLNETRASAACALIAMQAVPDKLGPVINALLQSIQEEPREIVQSISALHLAKLMLMNLKRQPNPNAKLMKRLLILATQRIADFNLDVSGAMPVSRRGCVKVLELVCGLFKENLFSEIPFLYESLCTRLKQLTRETANQLNSDVSFQEELFTELQIVDLLFPHLTSSLSLQVFEMRHSILCSLQSPSEKVRHLSSEVIHTFTQTFLYETMEFIVHNVIPILQDASNEVSHFMRFVIKFIACSLWGFSFASHGVIIYWNGHSSLSVLHHDSSAWKNN
jgi:TATA-binding protein-associated factor